MTTQEAVKVGVCERCGKEYEATHYAYKYCGDECRELGGVERRLGIEMGGLYGTADGEIEERECGGDCCKEAKRNIYKGMILTNTKWPARTGYKVKYCPYCGGRLVR